MRIAMIGTRGVPARYGGFETAVEEISVRLVERGHDVIVYCRNPGQTLTSYRGVRLVNLPALRRRSTETLSHSGLSVARAVVRDRPDVAFVFNAANAPYLPFLRGTGIPVAVNIDGLEWERAKWTGAGASYFRRATRWSVRMASAVVADAQGIADYVRRSYGRDSVFIPYGAEVIHPGSDRLREVGLEAGGYFLVVARFEPENHVEEIVAGYVRSAAQLPLLVVGGPRYSLDYAERVTAAADDPRVRLHGEVWDQPLLDQLYAGTTSYLHGHSVGGTNPSLLRAMGAGAPVIAYDCVFNREVAGEAARYFIEPEDVARAVEADEADPTGAATRGEAGQRRVARDYRWDDVALAYEELAARLVHERRTDRSLKPRRYPPPSSRPPHM